MAERKVIVNVDGQFQQLQSSDTIAYLDKVRGNWKVFYSDGSGTFQELALGSAGKVLQSNGTSSSPTFETPAAAPSFETSTANIIMDGSVSVGSGTTVPHSNHVHPTDTSRLAAARGNYKLFYSDGSGVFQELALGAAGTLLQSAGASSAPVMVQLPDVDGWTSAAETWTYASASTFTVPGDVSAKYPVGTKLKFTQTTVKYAVVISAVCTSSTLVTIAVNTDYTIASAVISANYFSYACTPQGYPAWFAWTPTITAYTGTFTSVSAAGKFSVSGRVVNYRIKITTTTKGSADTMAYSTLPIPAIDDLLQPMGTGQDDQGWLMSVELRVDASHIGIRKYDSTFADVFKNSTAQRISGWYAI